MFFISSISSLLKLYFLHFFITYIVFWFKCQSFFTYFCIFFLEHLILIINEYVMLIESNHAQRNLNLFLSKLLMVTYKSHYTHDCIISIETNHILETKIEAYSLLQHSKFITYDSKIKKLISKP